MWRRFVVLSRKLLLDLSAFTIAWNHEAQLIENEVTPLEDGISARIVLEKVSQFYSCS